MFVSLVAYFYFTTPNIGVLYIYNNNNNNMLAWSRTWLINILRG